MGKKQSEDNNKVFGFLALLGFLVLISEPIIGIAIIILAGSYKLYSDSNVPKEYYQKYKDHQEIIQEIEKQQAELERMKNDFEITKKEKEELELFISEESSRVDTLSTRVNVISDLSSNEIKNKLEMLNLKEKDFTKDRLKSKGKDSKKQLKQLYRAFNTEADAHINNVTSKNVDTQRKRIIRSFEQLNKLFTIDHVQLTKEYLEYKLKKLDLIYSYQITKQQEAELLKAKKEEIKEQQRVEKELQQKKKKVQKESTQFNKELSKMLKYLNQATNEVETNIYAEKIKELEAKIAELEEVKKDIEHREANTRAGFVYIISNIGSFGEGVYKIGMTRRLEPMHRINELSSASVPFKFDVHAMIFSDDAPALENSLHREFKDYEINKVNSRKEFFRVDIESIKEYINEHVDKSIVWIDEPSADEYYETMRIEQDAQA